jgi:xanthine dehydrogenase YagS FAD-binding subunit
MQPFTFFRPQTSQDAVRFALNVPAQAVTPDVLSPSHYISGGTNLADYMRLGVMRPSQVVDVSRLEDPRIEEIDISEAGIRFGALVSMAQAEDHPEIRRQYPVIHEALLSAATRQIRNMARLGGNVLQRTRCEYFRNVTWPCNKRSPGSGCSAVGGVNRQHAVLGTSDRCIAAYAGDFGQALAVLDAFVETTNGRGTRKIPFNDLHRAPGDTPEIETVLEPGELITAIHVPAGPHTQRSHYVKVRDRQSYQFALTGAAVALHLHAGVVVDVRIALSGVATRPWRAREAEAELTGRPINEANATRAAEAAFAKARPDTMNGFKIPIGKQTVVRALLEANAMEVLQ